MTVAVDISIIAEVSGLGEDLTFCEKFAVTETVIKAASNRQVQAATNTAEALNLCGIDADGVELVIIKATSKDLIIDTNCADNGSFVQDQSIAEGESRIIKPDDAIGTDGIFIKNGTAGEVVTVDYLIAGSA